MREVFRWSAAISDDGTVFSRGHRPPVVDAEGRRLDDADVFEVPSLLAVLRNSRASHSFISPLNLMELDITILHRSLGIFLNSLYIAKRKSCPEIFDFLVRLLLCILCMFPSGADSTERGSEAKLGQWLFIAIADQADLSLLLYPVYLASYSLVARVGTPGGLNDSAHLDSTRL